MAYEKISVEGIFFVFFFFGFILFLCHEDFKNRVLDPYDGYKEVP